MLQHLVQELSQEALMVAEQGLPQAGAGCRV